MEAISILNLAFTNIYPMARGMLTLIFAATAAITPTCADLTSKYDELEYGWAATHTLNVGMLKADEVFLQSFWDRGSRPLRRLFAAMLHGHGEFTSHRCGRRCR